MKPGEKEESEDFELSRLHSAGGVRSSAPKHSSLSSTRSLVPCAKQREFIEFETFNGCAIPIAIEFETSRRLSGWALRRQNETISEKQFLLSLARP